MMDPIKFHQGEVRRNEDGTPDEVVARDVELVHLEDMGSNGWWRGLNLKSGDMVHVRFWSKRRIHVIAELEPSCASQANEEE